MDVYGRLRLAPAHTTAAVPGVIVGTALTTMLIGCALPVPQLFVTVIVPV